MDLQVHITSVHGSQMAAKINGWFSLDGARHRFAAIAFGRIGGQNVGVTLSRAVQRRLRESGRDPEDVIMSLQKMLLEGNMALPKGLKRESFADG